MTQPSTQDTSTAQDFLLFLANLNKGRTVTELTERLQELVGEVGTTGKPGVLTFKVAVKPIITNKKSGVVTAVTVTDEVTVKLPQNDRPNSIFFRDDNNNLVRTDPRQTSLDI